MSSSVKWRQLSCPHSLQEGAGVSHPTSPVWYAVGLQQMPLLSFFVPFSDTLPKSQLLWIPHGFTDWLMAPCWSKEIPVTLTATVTHLLSRG